MDRTHDTTRQGEARAVERKPRDTVKSSKRSTYVSPAIVSTNAPREADKSKIANACTSYSTWRQD